MLFRSDPEDADPHRFLCYVIFALTKAGVKVGQLEMFAEQGLTELALEAVLARLLASIETEEERVSLILDDYHRLNAKAIDELMEKLIENAPGNLRVVVCSRQRPSFGVAQLCLSGRGIEIRAEALRFSEDEMRRALDDITDLRALATIRESTEGWPVAVQLARLAYREGDDVDALRMTSRGGHIADFFSEQVVRGLPDGLQRFLMRTSILEEFNVELADAVCGGPLARRALEDLRRLSALLVASEEEGDWYRYHHLFREFLRNLLLERESEHAPRLHARASRWFEADGDTFRAVHHAVLAGDVACAAELIEAAGGWELILFGGIGYLRNLLNLIPSSHIGAHPRLGVALSYLRIKQGDIAAARREFDHAVAQHRSGILAGSKFERDVTNIGAMLAAYEDDESAAEHWSSRDLTQKLANGEPDRVTNGMLACQRVVHRINRGDFDAARGTLREAMRHMRQGGSVLGLNYCYIHGAVINLHQCNFRQALADAHESSVMAEDNFGSDSGLKSLSEVVLRSMLFWRNELTDDGWSLFETAFEHITRYDGWVEVYALCLDTAVERALVLGDVDAARRSIEMVNRLAASRSLDRLTWQTDTMSLAVAVDQGDHTDQEILAARVRSRHPKGEWRRRRTLWRNHVHACLALASHFRERDPEESTALLADAKECCRSLGANFLLARTLCAEAALLDLSGQRPAAAEALRQAVSVSAPQGIPMVIVRPRSIFALLKFVRNRWRVELGDTATRRFVGEALSVMLRNVRMESAGGAAAVSLSPREMDVLLELERGASNKLIARALDMTEHTVKFHLKNVYKKLCVNRRTEALKVARDSGLI